MSDLVFCLILLISVMIIVWIACIIDSKSEDYRHVNKKIFLVGKTISTILLFSTLIMTVAIAVYLI